MHTALGHDMNRFIKKCVRIFSMIDNREIIYPYLFALNFLGGVIIVLQHALTFAMEKKIVLVGNACSRPPITIKPHNLHADDIKGVVGEIASYHKRD
jgi:hypothetical protein